MENMECKIVRFYDCKLNGEFKEKDNDIFQTLVKANVNDVMNIFLLEINKKQYDYLVRFDYKDEDSELFDIGGYIEVKKNKKDIPFLLIKATEVKLSRKRRKKTKKNIEQKKKKENEANKEKQFTFSKWEEKIKLLNLDTKVLDSRKIKLVDEEHLKNVRIDFSKNYIRNKELIALVSPIENSDEYKLVIGWKSLIMAKIFDKEIFCYLTDESKKEIKDKLINLQKEV
ncbi:hypothetical protein QJR26_19105 (plasmid) [Clostridium baratii]